MEQSRSYRFNCWLSDDPEKWILSASRAADDQWWITAFTGLSESAVRDRQLQLIQNAAAWVITRTKKKNKKNPQKTIQHITQVLGSLHWLPASHRINVRICLLVHKSVNGACPRDLSDLLTQCKPSGPLGPAGSGLLAVPRVQTKHGEAAVRQLSWGWRLCCLLYFRFTVLLINFLLNHIHLLVLLLLLCFIVFVLCLFGCLLAIIAGAIYFWYYCFNHLFFIVIVCIVNVKCFQLPCTQKVLYKYICVAYRGPKAASWVG